MTYKPVSNNATAENATAVNATAESDELLLERVRKHLDHSCDALDGQTLSRLNRIRHGALEKQQKPRNPFLLPFGGLVTACVLVLSVTLMDHQSIPESLPSGASALEDIEILTSAEELDFYENYEFYQWLADNDSSV